MVILLAIKNFHFCKWRIIVFDNGVFGKWYTSVTCGGIGGAFFRVDAYSSVFVG